MGTVTPLTCPWVPLGDKGGHTSVSATQPGMAYPLVTAHIKRATPLVDMAPPLAGVTISVTVTPLLPHTRRNWMQ